MNINDLIMTETRHCTKYGYCIIIIYAAQREYLNKGPSGSDVDRRCRNIYGGAEDRSRSGMGVVI